MKGMSVHPAAANSELPRTAPGLLRISIALLLVVGTANMALFGVLGVLLPSQIIVAVGDASKEAALGAISTLGAVIAMIAAPVLGAWSDRTRSRWGKRVPWLLGGAVGGLVGMNLVGVAPQILLIGLGWCVSQLGYNAVLMAYSTVLPDRVSPERRGLVSGVVGAATAIGLAGSQALAATFVERPLQGTLLLSVVAFVGAVAYAVIAPDHPTASRAGTAGTEATTDPAAEHVTRRRASGRLLLAPRAAPDFTWAWVGRFAMTLGYYLIASRLLYFVQDRLTIGVVEAATVVGSLGAVGAVAMLLPMILAGPLSDRVGRRPLVAGAAVVVGAGLVALCFVDGLMMLTLCYAAMSFGMGTFLSVDMALIADVLPTRDDAAKDLGLINLAAALPQTLAPALGSGLLLLSADAYPPLLIVGAVSTVVCVIATARIRGVR